MLQHQPAKPRTCSGWCVEVGAVVDQVLDLCRAAPDRRAVQWSRSVEQRRHDLSRDWTHLQACMCVVVDQC